jgi:hypothetical protein
LATTVGAVYCVYEDSGFLQESVERVYNSVDMIVFLVGTSTWCGHGNKTFVSETINKIRNFNDPDNKIHLVHRYWKTEADQRNFGTKYLRINDIEWHFIIDDDELYNKRELDNAISRLDVGYNSAYLVNQQWYWKKREWAIEADPAAFPAFLITDGKVKFSTNRMMVVEKGRTWTSFSAKDIVCHHMSYIRSDEAMLRKISNFSHADEIKDKWFDEIWMKWKLGDKNFHPTNPKCFRDIIPPDKTPYRLI